MKTPYEKRTEEMAIEYAESYKFHIENPHTRQIMDFKRGRDSAKESLEIACRALGDIQNWTDCEEAEDRASAAIESIKKNGNWPFPLKDEGV